MRHPTFSAAGRWPIAVLLACLIAGCGVGTYNESVEQRTQSLGRAAPFTQLFGAQPIADASVTIRVPQLFKTSFQEGSADPKNPNQKIDPPIMDRNRLASQAGRSTTQAVYIPQFV